MKRSIAVLSLLLMLLVVPVAVAATSFDVYYDLDGVIKSPPPETVPGASSASCISAFLLSRGPGIAATALTNGFSANEWNMADPSMESALDVDAYFQFGLNVKNGHTASLESLDLSLRRSAKNGPMNYALYVSLDDFATPGVLVDTWTYRGRVSGTAPAIDPVSDIPHYYMDFDLAGRPNTTTSPGDPIPTIDLTEFDELQNISGDTDVTFRLFAWGNASTTETN